MSGVFDWRTLGVVLLGGGIGSVLRYIVTALVTQRLGPGFAWGTFLINISGSLIIGLVFEFSQTRAFGVSPLVRAFLMVGVLGGYTTFSTFALDMVQSASEGASLVALGYGGASVVLGFAAAYLGIVLARAL